MLYDEGLYLTIASCSITCGGGEIDTGLTLCDRHIGLGGKEGLARKIPEERVFGNLRDLL